MNFRLLIIHPILIGCFAVTGCSSDDDAVFSRGRNFESKPKRTLLASLQNAQSGSDDEEVLDAVARVKYKLRISTNSGATICNGETEIEVLSDFGVKLPNAYVDCLSLHLDLGAILAGQTTGSFGNLSAIRHDGKTLSIAEIANAKFEPPRPILLGPLVQDPQKYRNYAANTKHRLIAENSEGEEISASGTFNVKVVAEQTTYSDPNESNIFFDKVLHWEIASDFDAPAKYGLTIAKMTWFWNTRPIMIPGIIIEGTLKDFIETETADLADTVAGPLKIEIFVREYEFK